jgi:hypothetical protein
MKDGNRKPWQVCERELGGHRGPRIEWEEHMWKLTWKKREAVAEGDWGLKDRKAFRI